MNITPILNPVASGRARLELVVALVRECAAGALDDDLEPHHYSDLALSFKRDTQVKPPGLGQV